MLYFLIIFVNKYENNLFQKQYIAIVFLLLFLMSIIKPIIPYAIYYANYEEIVTEKCVSKDKPEMACNGKCYVKAIKKRLNPEQENTPKSTLPTHKNKTLEFLFKEYDYAISLTKSFKCRNPLNFHKHFVISEYSISIFRPPEQIV